jgi:DNA-binding MarR family transcriptional regulator
MTLNYHEKKIFKAIGESMLPLTAGEISKKSGVSHQTVKKYIPVLEKQGLIEKKVYAKGFGNRYTHYIPTEEVEKRIQENIMKEEAKKECPKDSNKRHRWEKIGCDKEMIIYQCHQCRKCAFEPIEIIGNIKDV